MASSLIGMALGKVASGASRAFLGGGVRRVATGVGIGGLLGAATSDRNSPTGRLQDIAGGALLGLGIAGLTTRTAGVIGKGIGKAFWRSKGAIGRAGLRAGRGLGNIAVNFALKHPVLTFGGIATGMAYSSLFRPDTLRGAALEAAQNEISGPSTPTQQFQSSTDGIVQGLHRRRRS